MRTVAHRFPCRAAFLAAALSGLLGCENAPQQKQAPALAKFSDLDPDKQKEKNKKNGKDVEMDPDKVRNIALEAIKKNQERMLESQKAAQAGGKENKNSPKKKNSEPQPFEIFSKKGANSAEIPAGKFGKGPDSFGSTTSSSRKGNLAEITGPGQKSPSFTGDSATIADNRKSGKKDSEQADLKVIQGRGSAEFGDQADGKKDEKPGFFSKLFGNEKPDRKIVKPLESGSRFELVNEKMKTKNVEHVFEEKPDGTMLGAQSRYTKQELQQRYNPLGNNEPPKLGALKHTPPENHGALSDMVRQELVQDRLKREVERKRRKEETGKDAVVVPLEDDKNGLKKRAITDFDTPPPTAKSGASNAANAQATGLAAAGGAALGTAALSRMPVADFNGTQAEQASEAQTALPGPGPAAPAEMRSSDIQLSAADKKKAADAVDKAAVEAQLQFGSLEEYRKGLDSRDVVAREKSFYRAVAEKRDDAIPYLADEVIRNGILSEFAARGLATIGKRSELTDRALLQGLNTVSPKEVTLREACAEAAGQLRIQRAVPLLIDKAKNDPNLRIRTTCVASLGIIGDRAALPVLHMKLDDKGEIEFVKQSAALALARFGDPAGREHLLQSLDSNDSALQVLGITGLAQLNDPDTPGQLISRLDSDREEVWTTVVQLFPQLGAPMAIPMLRNQLLSGNESMRVRAALALGYLGNGDGTAFICRACRNGSLQERRMACELLGLLGRGDQIPLLIEKLGDAHTDVRQSAAIALTRLKAAAAIPALGEAARGRLQNQQLPPALRGAQSDMNERVVMLACLRILRGEKEDLALYTLPNHDQNWPELDRELLKQQIEMLKMYKLMDVIPSGAQGTGALVQAPDGRELLFREGETVAAGFKITSIGLGGSNLETQAKVPPFVTLQRGNEKLTLYVGQ